MYLHINVSLKFTQKHCNHYHQTLTDCVCELAAFYCTISCHLYITSPVHQQDNTLVSSVLFILIVWVLFFPRFSPKKSFLMKKNEAAAFVC